MDNQPIKPKEDKRPPIIHLRDVEVTQGGLSLVGNDGMDINLEKIITRDSINLSNNTVLDGNAAIDKVSKRVLLSQVTADGNVIVNTGDTFNTINNQTITPIHHYLHQLPAPPADFVGRGIELNQLLEKIRKGDVTISGVHGMGGVGKTALALKLADVLITDYPDAQFYLDLKGLDTMSLTATEAMIHIIHSFNPETKLPDDAQAIVGSYRSVLYNKKCLLLMDNAKDAQQISPLIPPQGNLLIVTSRTHFTLPGMTELDLEALPKEDAVKLLLEIAPKIGDDATQIAELCSCIPLALRVIASQVRERADLSSAKLILRLKDDQKKLKLSEMDSVLQVSYELLTLELQKCLCELSVFANSFDSAAAAAVWAIDKDKADDLLAACRSEVLGKRDEVVN